MTNNIEPNGSDREPWFDPGLIPGTDRLREVADLIADAVEHHGAKRKLKDEERSKLRDVLSRVIANLAHHYLSGRPGGFIVPRSKKVLGLKPTRYQQFAYPKPFPKWLDALEALGFLKQRKGQEAKWPAKARRTTIEAGPKLVRLLKDHSVTFADIRDEGLHEVIILSRSRRGYWDDNSHDRRIDYEDTPASERFRRELKGVNSWLAEADIQFDARMYNRPVDVYARRLFRRFTQSRFDSGGRLFGGFWQSLPNKPDRFPYSVRLCGLRIEGEHVAGLDYSQLNPILCYSIVGADPGTADAYTLPGLEQFRDSVKRVFNTMLFHYPVTKFPKRTKEEVKAGKRLFPKEIKCGGVVAMILHYHKPLKAILCSGNIGHHLQFLESQIMMAVLERCRERNIVALPVFDCVVVKKSAVTATKEIMQREFKTRTGLSIIVKQELEVSEHLPYA